MGKLYTQVIRAKIWTGCHARTLTKWRHIRRGPPESSRKSSRVKQAWLGNTRAWLVSARDSHPDQEISLVWDSKTSHVLGAFQMWVRYRLAEEEGWDWDLAPEVGPLGSSIPHQRPENTSDAVLSTMSCMCKSLPIPSYARSCKTCKFTLYCRLYVLNICKNTYSAPNAAKSPKYGCAHRFPGELESPCGYTPVYISQVLPMMLFLRSVLVTWYHLTWGGDNVVQSPGRIPNAVILGCTPSLPLTVVWWAHGWVKFSLAYRCPVGRNGLNWPLQIQWSFWWIVLWLHLLVKETTWP